MGAFHIHGTLPPPHNLGSQLRLRFRTRGPYQLDSNIARPPRPVEIHQAVAPSLACCMNAGLCFAQHICHSLSSCQYQSPVPGPFRSWLCASICLICFLLQLSFLRRSWRNKRRYLLPLCTRFRWSNVDRNIMIYVALQGSSVSTAILIVLC